jgi:hypothetical protein
VFLQEDVLVDVPRHSVDDTGRGKGSDLRYQNGSVLLGCRRARAGMPQTHVKEAQPWLIGWERTPSMQMVS